MTSGYKLSNGSTVEQVIAELTELAEFGLTFLGQSELSGLVAAAGKLAEDAATLITDPPTQGEILAGEVDAEQAAGDAAELAKVGK
jgi:hypothetical protein